jgi:hypothetical protein
MLIMRPTDKAKPAGRQGRIIRGLWPSGLAGLLGLRQPGFFPLRVACNPMVSYEAT